MCKVSSLQAKWGAWKGFENIFAGLDSFYGKLKKFQASFCFLFQLRLELLTS